MQGIIARAPAIGAGTIRGARRLASTKRLLALVLAVIGIGAVASLGSHYWRVGRFMVETDDAYVQADSITIAPRVAGYIAEVLVSDNQSVRAGQVLAQIDE